MPKQHTPHDRLFRETLSRRSQAILFFKHFLPQDIARHLDFRTLKLQNSSFVNERLENHFSDIVYACRWKKSGQEAILTFVLEHKSYPEKYPHLQLLRYMLEGYSYQLRQNKKLSLIIPVVLYHGREKWQARPFKDYFELPHPLFGMFVPSFDYILVDLAEYADEQILAIGMSFLASSLLLFKHKQDKDFVLNNYRQIFIFVEGYESRTETMRYLDTLILYVFQSFDIERKEILEIIDDLPKHVSDMFVSTYDKAIESGKIKGEELGMKKGEELGMKKGEQLGMKKGEQLGMKKGEQLGMKKGEQLGMKKGEQLGIEKGAAIGLRRRSVEVVLEMLASFPELKDQGIANLSKMPEGFVAKLRSCFQEKDLKAATKVIAGVFKDLPHTPASELAALQEQARSAIKKRGKKNGA